MMISTRRSYGRDLAWPPSPGGFEELQSKLAEKGAGGGEETTFTGLTSKDCLSPRTTVPKKKDE